MAVVSFAPSAWTSGFASTDLDSLANGGQKTSSLSTFIENTGGAAQAIQFEVSLAALSPTSGANLIIGCLPESRTSGTYATGTDGTTANDQYRWQNFPNALIALRLTASTAQIQRSSFIPIWPERYKLFVVNRSGVALPTGNTVFWRTYTETVA